ncbi:transporter substrate-binding domain-containing protein [Streptococcus ferus]|uniref:transporter substrate-binding domain-containing protein n=1 Tax=Streptococcus ferus TaxID=1345 RepID=UPI00359FFDFE
MKLKTIVKVGSLALLSALAVAAVTSKNEASAASKKETVTLATVGTTKPFSYEKDGKLTGYDIEVARAVFKGSSKYKLKIQKTSWTSVFSGLDSDKFQIGANNISYSEERAAKYLYSNPTATNPLVLAVNKDSKIKSFDDIAGKSTQVVQGTSTAKLLEDYNKEHPDAKTEINYTSEEIGPMLLNVDNGKYDYKIFETQTIKTIVKEQGLDNIKIRELDLDSNDKPYVYFVFAQDQKDLQTFVNKRIKTLYDNGTLEKLSKKFLDGSYLPDKADIK